MAYLLIGKYCIIMFLLRLDRLTGNSSEVWEGDADQCGTGYLSCRDNTCFREHLACDTLIDCPDATDEENCSM